MPELVVLNAGDYVTDGKRRMFVWEQCGDWKNPGVTLYHPSTRKKVNVPLAEFPDKWRLDERNLTCAPRICGAYNERPN